MPALIQEGTPSLSHALHALTERSAWLGTATELAAALRQEGLSDTCGPARLSALLRDREPSLYWQGIAVSFRRKPGSGERLIEIARRGA
jgi:hypothetical protein